MRGNDADAVRAGIFRASPGSSSSRTGASTEAYDRALEARQRWAHGLSMAELALAGTADVFDLGDVESAPDLTDVSVYPASPPRLPPPPWSLALRREAAGSPYSFLPPAQRFGPLDGLGQAETAPAPAPGPTLTPGPVPWPLLLAAGALALLLLGDGSGGEQPQS